MRRALFVVLMLIACGPAEGEPCAEVQPHPCEPKTAGLSGLACVCARAFCDGGDPGVWREVSCPKT